MSLFKVIPSSPGIMALPAVLGGSVIAYSWELRTVAVALPFASIALLSLVAGGSELKVCSGFKGFKIGGIFKRCTDPFTIVTAKNTQSIDNLTFKGKSL